MTVNVNNSSCSSGISMNQPFILQLQHKNEPVVHIAEAA